MKKNKLKSLSLMTAWLLALTSFSGCVFPHQSATTPTEKPPVNEPTENEDVDIDAPEIEDENATYIDGTKLCPLPEVGTPLEYTGAQNVSFMAYQLAHAEHYRLDVNATVTTKILFISYEQKVQTYKDYKDGVMIAVDISNSTFVNLAKQTCEIGGKSVTRASAESDASKWSGRDTAWSTNDKDVTVYSSEEYKKAFGLPYTAFSVYVLSNKTIDRWSEVIQNADGTYTQTIYPNVQKASEYYAISMKNNGGLTSLPKFHSIAITYTFDSEWHVLSSVTTENYGIEMSVIKSDDCSAVTYQTYDYTTAADTSDFEGYFKKYF